MNASSRLLPPRPAHTVGLVVHPERSRAWRSALAAATQLRDRGVRVIGCKQDLWPVDDKAELVSPDAFGAGLDVVLVFGGDGTFLRAAYLARDAGVPLLGVNLGRLGFLSEVEEDEVGDALGRLIAGDYAIEERMTLAVSIHDHDGEVVAASWALNEASVERRDPQRLIVLEVQVGDTLLTSIPADALICATPTGSTAYAFSAGGPILSPLLQAVLLVPVAPHALFDRTIVVDPAESVRVRPATEKNPSVVSLDGREPLVVPPGGFVKVCLGEQPVRLVRLAPFNFYERVREKFRLE